MRMGTVRMSLLVAACLALGGVLSAQPEVPAGVTPALADDAYILQCGDVLQVRFFYNPELNDTLPIRPDGMISLDLVGDVRAAGLAPQKLREVLIERFSQALKRPEINVVVKEFGGRKIYVAGEVAHPGIVRAPGPLTVLQAVLETGGFLHTAELKNVVVLRYQGTTKPLFLSVNLKEQLKARRPSPDPSPTGSDDAELLLRPYDIVFVPKTRIASMNQFVDQYIRQLLPIPSAFGISYIFGNRQLDVR